jgi:hypothetical protein
MSGYFFEGTKSWKSMMSTQVTTVLMSIESKVIQKLPKLKASTRP